MYEQKQIILNGEILANNVVINRYFELIYKISPLIIKNFINIINETPFLSNPVRIKKYNFIEINCINIHFKSKTSTGEVQLAYILNKNNELVIDTYKLLITEGENQGYFREMQNNNARSELKNLLPQKFGISQVQDDFIEIYNDQNKSSMQVVKEEFNSSYNKEESSIENLILANTEAKNNTDNISNVHCIQKTTEEEIISEKELIEIKKSIYNKNINTKNKNTIDIKEINQEENSSKGDSEEKGNNTKQDCSKISLKDDEFFEKAFLENNNQNKNEIETQDQEDPIYYNDLALNENISEVKKENPLNDININNINNIDVEKLNIIESTLNDKITEFERMNIQEFDNVLDITEKKCCLYNDEEIEQGYINTKDINPLENSIDYDLVDFFDIIPKLIDECIEEEEKEEENSVDKEDVVIENAPEAETEINNIDNFGYKKNRKRYKLNRTEKIALYQNILKGYDDKMTENKLSKFKDSFKSIQKDDNISIEDVLDAQVELLVDNKSKAFRILGDDLKQDVIQIDKELFLSKDKIYTWGDAYLLDYNFD